MVKKKKTSYLLYLYRVLYPILLLFYIPFLLYHSWKKKTFEQLKKKWQPTPVSRLKSKHTPLIWIHAVSLGETLAVQSYIELHKKNYPEHEYITSHGTIAGVEASKKIFPFAHAHVYLPFDLSLLYKKLLQNIEKIDLLIYSEGDIWPIFTDIAKKKGATAVVINGKMSERSFLFYKKFPKFLQALILPIDLLCLQDKEYQRRYVSLGIENQKLIVTGNIKGDRKVTRMSSIDREELLQKLGCIKDDKIVVIASTHEPEELEILYALDKKELLQKYRFLIIPRHAHRFYEVFQKISHHFPKATTALFSKNCNDTPWNILIIDQMGMLMSLYQLAKVSCIGGSFIKTIGGHNILEPALVGCPSITGPYMQSQISLYESAVIFDAITQVQDYDSLADEVSTLLEDQKEHIRRAKAAIDWKSSMTGSSDKTMNAISSFL